MRVWILSIFLFAGGVRAEDICDKRNVFIASYPIVSSLRETLCKLPTNRGDYLTFDAAKASPNIELRWIAKMWQRNYQGETRVSYNRVFEGYAEECNNAAREGVVLASIFRRKLYVQADFFGTIPPSKKLEAFTDQDAKNEYIARIRKMCGVDLNVQKLNWQVLDY